jgi:hypothetical protein
MDAVPDARIGGGNFATQKAGARQSFWQNTTEPVSFYASHTEFHCLQGVAQGGASPQSRAGSRVSTAPAHAPP